MILGSNQGGNFVSVCKDVISLLQLLLPNIEAPVLIQFLAKDPQEVSALSKRFWDLGKYVKK